MSFLAVFTVQENIYFGFTQTHHLVIESLDQLNNLNIDKLLAVYEIARVVPIEHKHAEVIEVVKTQPYYDVDGVKVTGKVRESIFTISGSRELTASSGTLTNAPGKITLV